MPATYTPYTPCSQSPLRLAAKTLLAWLALITVAHAQFAPAVNTVRDFQRFHVRADGSYTQYLEQQVRVETEQAVQTHSELRQYYNAALEDLEVLEAYTLQPDGSRITVPPDRIRTQETVEDAMYSDDKVRIIIYPQVMPGSQLVLRVNSVVHTPLFPGHFFWAERFSPHRRYGNSTLELSHDAGIDIRVSTDRVAGGLLAAEPGDAPGFKRYRCQYQPAQALPPARGQVDLLDFTPHVLISSFASYTDLARAYQDRAKPMARVTPKIAALAKSLVAGATDDATRVRRLYNWVARNIRYVAVYAGAGGFVPHDSQSILDNRYGDCKDHVVMLEALLTAVGIDSSPALINANGAFKLPSLPVPDPFDHVITYVPALNLFLDSTSSFTPMGRLPDGDQDKPVLLTATGTLSRSPASSAEQDQTDTQVWLQLQSDGRVSGRSVVRMRGAPESDSRFSHFGYQSQEPVDTINRILARFAESGTGSIEAGDPTDLDTPWQVAASFVLDPLVNVPGPAAMTIPIGLASGNIRSRMSIKPLLNRQFPGVCTSMQHSEQIELAFMPEMQVTRIPPDVSFSRGPLSYQSSYRFKDQVLQVKRNYTVRRNGPVCNEKDDQDWLALSEWLQRDLRAQVFFETR